MMMMMIGWLLQCCRLVMKSAADELSHLYKSPDTRSQAGYHCRTAAGLDQVFLLWNIRSVDYNLIILIV